LLHAHVPSLLRRQRSRGSLMLTPPVKRLRIQAQTVDLDER
jgi:hypothetical protein